MTGLLLSRRIRGVYIVAFLVTLVAAVAGLVISFSWDLPTAPTIVCKGCFSLWRCWCGRASPALYPQVVRNWRVQQRSAVSFQQSAFSPAGDERKMRDFRNLKV